MRSLATPAVYRADFDRIALAHCQDPDLVDRQVRGLLDLVPRPCPLALEVGAGLGAVSRALARRCGRVRGIDLSPNMVRFARERTEEVANLSFEVGDVMRAPLPPDRFDCVVTVATVHHLPLRPALERLAYLLRPGGVALVLDLYQPSSWRDHVSGGLGWGLARVGRVRGPRRHVAAAWRAHGEHDRLLSWPEVCSGYDRVWPGASVRRHLGCRYSVVWRKPS